jgi:hypothetical protein
MKKILIVFGIAAIGFTVIACKKECKCTEKSSRGGQMTDTFGSDIDTKEKCMEQEPLRKALLDSLGKDISNYNYKCEFK